MRMRAVVHVGDSAIEARADVADKGIILTVGDSISGDQSAHLYMTPPRALEMAQALEDAVKSSRSMDQLAAFSTIIERHGLDPSDFHVIAGMVHPTVSGLVSMLNRQGHVEAAAELVGFMKALNQTTG